MGVVLTPIVSRHQSSLQALKGRSFAIDASIEIHRFLALIRRPDGTLFTDRSGRPTSHLMGLLTWTSRLITEYAMQLIFVFDGPPDPLKQRTLEARRVARQKAESEYSRAISAGDYSTAWSKAVMTGKVTLSVLDDSKRLLTLMGVDWLEAPGDAEAQASYMARRELVWAVGSKDYDCLLYGAPILTRYLSIAGQEFLPAQRRTRRLLPEIINLAENLETMGITREQLVDLAILVGTDFNEGVTGIGPKKALNLVHKFGSLEQIPERIVTHLPEGFDEVRTIFLQPRIIEDFALKKAKPDQDGLTEFLVTERAFSKDRVEAVAEKLARSCEYRDTGLARWLK